MDNLTNNTRKLYASLGTAKGRRATGLFMAQGTKCVLDTFGHFQCECVLATSQWMEAHTTVPAMAVKVSDLERISTLSTPPQVVAIYHIPEDDALCFNAQELSLALDCVQDPGNLGTIIRVADWMGIGNIYASLDTADVWNPKVVQATMGAISRVKVHYLNLADFLRSLRDVPVYGTFLEGDNIYKSNLTSHGVIIMGNEGNGISTEVGQYVNHKLHIPSYPIGVPTSESLNVAIATAITLSEFRRNG